MNLKRRQKLLWLTLLLAGVSIAVGLTLYALKQNINLFYTPSQVQRGEVPQQRYFRIGGLVKADSLQRAKNDLQVSFVVTDQAQDVRVTYKGILPDLFREGQGVVAQGKLNKQGVFVADQVLAKHDEKYMPPEAAYAIEQAQAMK